VSGCFLGAFISFGLIRGVRRRFGTDMNVCGACENVVGIPWINRASGSSICGNHILGLCPASSSDRSWRPDTNMIMGCLWGSSEDGLLPSCYFMVLSFVQGTT
jgi:hypothetical protein